MCSSKHTQLIISDSENAELEINPTGILYRSFDEKSHSENFLNGNVWLAGSNTNRFNNGDHAFHNANNNTRIHVLTLSFTMDTPENRDPKALKTWIKITNIVGFVQNLKNDLIRNNIHHVSWHDKNVLLGKAKKIKSNVLPNLTSINTAIVEKLDLLRVNLYSIVGRKMDYYDPSVPVPLPSLEAVRRASSVVKKFEEEAEYQLEFNISSFFDLNGKNLPPNSGHLVEYMKLHHPSVKKYCELI